MFICWSFSTFSGNEWTTVAPYPAYFRATTCNTDQWCRTAKNAGMNYILFLAKHHDGFCLWDTKTTDLKVTNAPLGKDVVEMVRKSCSKYGLKLALYFSEGDWTWPGAERGKHNMGGYNPEMKKAQLEELLTEYGPIEFIWFDRAAGDGGLSHDETTAWVNQLQPNCVVGYNHGDPSGRLSIGEMGNPGPVKQKGNTNYLAAEFTYPILPPHKGGANWFYSLPEHDNLCHPASKIFSDYQGAIQHGNIFSLNVGPNYEGLIREIDVKTLQEVGKMITNNKK